MPKNRNPSRAAVFLVAADHRLDLRVVGRDPAAHEPERRRQAVEHVDLDGHALVHEHVFGGVEARRAGADDRDAERAVWSPSHVVVPNAIASLAAGGRGAVERVERGGHRHRDAGEDRGVAQGVGARLGRAQLLDEIEELARVVGLERDDELLVVEPERVRGVDRDLAGSGADLDVLAMIRWRSSAGSRYHSRFFQNG